MNEFGVEGNALKRRVISLLIILFVASSSAWAYDIDIFDECSVAIKPNVLFLMDTSLSMRRQDVIDNGIESYNSEGAFIITRDATGEVTNVQIDPNNDADDPSTDEVEEQSYLDRGYEGDSAMNRSRDRDYEDNIFRWNKDLKQWYRYRAAAGQHHLELHEIPNKDVLEAFLRFGTFQGNIDHWGNLKEDDDYRIYATGDYINYLKYVEAAQATIDWDEDNEYDETIDYRRFHGADADGKPLGYGEYITSKVYVRMAGDIRPFNSIRNILNSSPNGIYIDDPGNTGREILDCSTALAALKVDGWTRSKVWEAFGCDCGGLITYTLMTGNFLNYLDMKKSRRYNAIDAVWSVINNRPNDGRYGIMQFDLGIFSTFFDLSHWRTQGADLAAPCGSSTDTLKRVLYGEYDHEHRTSIPEYGQPLYFGHPSDISKETPLAEALIEAGCYFSGQNSWFNSDPIPDSFFDSTHTGTTSNTTCRYKSPIQCKDQKNHIVILTDGAPKDDFEVFDGLLTNKGKGVSWNWILNKNFDYFNPDTNAAVSAPIGNCFIPVSPLVDNDVEMILGSTLNINYKQQWLDDVAYFLYQKDMTDKDNDEGRQNIHTHAVGFVVAANANSLDRPLLIQTAENGKGHYMFTSSKDELIAELNSILDTVMEDFSFSSASTPVSQSDMVYSGNDMYMSSFILEAGARGRGNVLKFERDHDVVTGHADENLFELDGSVNGDTRDWWFPGSEPAGNNPEDPIPSHGLARKLYSQIQPGASLGVNPTPEATFNAVKSKRSIYIPYQSGVGGWTLGDVGTLSTDGAITIPKEDGTNYSGDELYRFLYKRIYGYGYNWPLGDIIHSNIVVAQYPRTTEHDYGVDSYLFVGTNTGKLHCFNAASGNATGAGEEVWSLIYPDFKDRLHQLESFFDKDERWFADGWITLYNKHVKHAAAGGNGAYSVVTPSYLIAGERRGGSSYHLLKITDVDSPEYIAKIGGIDPWGQSWSKPDMCQVVKAGEGLKTAFLVTGGYDTNQDALFPGTDQKGRFVALYGIDGNLIKRFPESGAGSEACIVSARIIDHDHTVNAYNERVFSRIYAGDLKGNVYHSTDDLTATGQAKTPDGSWALSHKLFSGHSVSARINRTNGTLHQKIFYPPIAGMACAENRVFFGTGDRENPLFSYATFRDSVYSVPESWSKTFSRDDLNKFTLDENNIVTDTNFGSGVTKEVYNNISKTEPVNKEACEGGCHATYTNCMENCDLHPDDDGCSTSCITQQINCKSYCGSGWFFDFVREGEKQVSESIVLDNTLIFATYTPPEVTLSADVCNAGGTCTPGAGRVYVISTCEDAFSVKSYKLKNNPMPQPSLVFDEKTGEVLVSTGDGQIIDPELPVVVPDYWKHSGADL
ncbi:type IV pili system adhesin PilY [Desulfoluna limicola]|uniref:Type IV pili system adhesin PilY n=1 Tax=Desulfoluna limicola TaxID=2810562 RepID=A0ABN6FAJ0_9BACT|nr:hypothetical protein [Desulfoluna limicola]BCS99266.1 type IV pili system adhesin PilY [Desulfoluna limicola]